MTKRFTKLAWAIQRFRTKRFIGFIGIIVGASFSVWLYLQWEAAPVLSAIGIFLAGLLLARPVAALARRLFVRTPSWRHLGSLEFGGVDLGFELTGSGFGKAPREIVEQIASPGDRFGDGRFSLILWLVAADEAGDHWTLVQEKQHESTGQTVWTGSVDGNLTIADLDESGRPNPFRAAHRLAKSELDLSLLDVSIVAWGRELLVDGSRDVAIGLAHTAVPAERLRSVAYPRATFKRRSHLVTLDPHGTAKALGWSLPGNWLGGAVLGMLEALEHVESGSWLALERALVPRWREKLKFARIDRGIEHLTGRAYSTSGRLK